MLEVGVVSRSHGLRGEVVVKLLTTEQARVAPGSTLDVDGRALTVRTSRPHQKHWVVAFDGVTTREAADDLRGAILSAEPVAAEDDDALWVHELIGARVVDVDDVDRGVIEAVQDNPASDVLVLDTGALVPLTFAVGWDVRGERLRIDPPPGLFEL